MGERARNVLAANLVRLMEASESCRTIKLLSAKSGVSNGTIDRLRRAEVSAGVDHLDDLAKAFGLEPWQLLVEGAQLPELSADALEFAKRYEAMSPGERSKLRLLYNVARDGKNPDAKTWTAPVAESVAKKPTHR